MKKLITIGILLLSGMILYGQSSEKSLSEGDTVKSQPSTKQLGWYVSLSNLNTQLRSTTVDMPGMSAAIIINHNFALGLRVNAMNDLKRTGGIYSDKDTYLICGYGGIFVQPIIHPEKKFHVTFPVCTGLGVAGYFERTDGTENDAYVPECLKLKDQDVFLVLEPGIEFEINALKWMKISAGISYRFVGGLNIHNTGIHAFDGITGSVKIKMGQF